LANRLEFQIVWSGTVDNAAHQAVTPGITDYSS
jgi:hypothetical protein